MLNFTEFVLNENAGAPDVFISFVNSIHTDIDTAKSTDDIENICMKLTMGFLPLNPPDPTRTLLRDKVTELLEKASYGDAGFYKNIFDRTRG